MMRSSSSPRLLSRQPSRAQEPPRRRPASAVARFRSLQALDADHDNALSAAEVANAASS
jgi:hypothetical protein